MTLAALVGSALAGLLISPAGLILVLVGLHLSNMTLVLFGLSATSVLFTSTLKCT